ncbi:MAG: hypothetical protein IJ222_10195 [Bacteroidales bacterium]|nr:hypothetical protein [Bacteroidales bacterium]
MKKFYYLIIALLLISLTAASAQESRLSGKRLQNSVLIAGGLFSESGSMANDVFPGAILRFSYGLDILLNNNWSIMPGAGVRVQVGEINHLGWVGGDPDAMDMADIYCQARYRVQADGATMIIGLGPQISRMIEPDTYYIDANPNDPLDGKDKFTRWSFSLMPSITFQQGKRFQWGFEANIGLSNSMKQYPELGRTGVIRFQYTALTCGWHF